MDVEKFIECVKKYPMLYDIQNNQYKNFAQKNRVWKQIAVEMNESSEVLRTKWKGLKDGYTKYKKWQLYRNLSGKTYSNWCWGPHLDFLGPFVHQRKRKYHNTPSEDDNGFLHLEVAPTPYQENEKEITSDDALQNECVFKIEAPKSVPSSPCTSRSQSPTSLRDPMGLIETDDNTKLLSFMQTKRSKGIDAVDLLFMSYAETFKKFSVETQTKLKINMATVFAEAELQEHNANRSVLP